MLAALSLLLPYTLGFDPWAWLVWRREFAHFTLDTAHGPSWKPLPVLADALLSLAGSAAPALRLLLARTGSLLAVAAAYLLGARLAGRLGGVVAAAALVVTTAPGVFPGWIDVFAAGWSEGLLTAFVLFAVERHLASSLNRALLLCCAAGLIRPEAWLFALAYAALRAWRERGRRLFLVAATVVVPLLWVVPDLLASGQFLRAGTRARASVPGALAHAAHPGLTVLGYAAAMPAPGVLAAAAAGVTFAIQRRERATLSIAALAVGWTLVIAAMAEAGYPGLPRFLLPAIALGGVVGGAGVSALLPAVSGIPACESGVPGAPAGRPPARCSPPSSSSACWVFAPSRASAPRSDRRSSPCAACASTGSCARGSCTRVAPRRSEAADGSGATRSRPPSSRGTSGRHGRSPHTAR